MQSSDSLLPSPSIHITMFQLIFFSLFLQDINIFDLFYVPKEYKWNVWLLYDVFLSWKGPFRLNVDHVLTLRGPNNSKEALIIQRGQIV